MTMRNARVKGPQNRPRCIGCRKELTPTFRTREVRTESRNGYEYKSVEDVTIHWFGHHLTDNLFCTLRCATAWAIEQHYDERRRRADWLRQYNERAEALKQ